VNYNKFKGIAKQYNNKISRRVYNLALNGLKKVRIENGFTQRQVSEILKMPLDTYKNYEQGKREPKIDTLKQLATLFKCKIDDFI
jgi:DNA-binding XRE family transcriptional regulator